MKISEYLTESASLAGDVCDSLIDEVAEVPENLSKAVDSFQEFAASVPQAFTSSSSAYAYGLADKAGAVADIAENLIENPLSFAEIMDYWTNQFNGLGDSLSIDTDSPPACLGSIEGKVFGFGGRSGGGGANGDWGRESPPRYPRGGRWPRFPVPYPKSGKTLPIVEPPAPDGCLAKRTPVVGQIVDSYFEDELFHVIFCDGIFLEEQSNVGSYAPSVYSSAWLYDAFAIPDELLSVPPDGFYGIVATYHSLPMSASNNAYYNYTHAFWSCGWSNAFDYRLGSEIVHLFRICWESGLVRSECFDCWTSLDWYNEELYPNGFNFSSGQIPGWGNPGGSWQNDNGTFTSGFGRSRGFTLCHTVFKKIGNIEEVIFPEKPPLALGVRLPLFLGNFKENYGKNFNAISRPSGLCL